MWKFEVGKDQDCDDRNFSNFTELRHYAEDMDFYWT